MRNKNNKIPEKYLKLDDIADGVFVSGKDSCPNLYMPALMAYCKKKKIWPNELPKEELLKFIKE